MAETKKRSNDINSVVLTGRIANEPQVQKDDKGNVSIVRFTIANNSFYSDEPNWIHCVAFKHTAEFIAKYLGKGSAIAINGEISAKKFTDKDGNTRVEPSITITNIKSIGGVNNTGSTKQENKNESADEEIGEEVEDDDLPF